MTRRIASALALAALLAQPLAAQETQMTAIRIIVGTETIDAVLDDTAPARDFASMLPLELSLSPYHGTEMVGDLGRKLDATGMPAAYEPKAGDITQYGPWKNLAIFTKPFSRSQGLVRLGEIQGSFAALVAQTDVMVRIERAD